MTDLQQTDDQTPMTAQTIRSVPIEDIKGQVQDIQRVMDSLMQEGTHYDDVTGDGRNSLLQPGAEKLCFAFQFAPSFESERREIPPSEVPNAEGEVQGHREYEVECRLHHRPSGEYIGSGRGSCSTLESKYRYRKIDEETEVPIPGDFWDSYEDSMANADFSILEEELVKNGVDIPEGGEAGVTKNDDGEWRITVQAKGENPDIADQYNTVLKMAEKRALVNAVKRCTAASDIFTQDTEDLAVRSGSNVKRDTSGKASGRRSGSGAASKPNGNGGHQTRSSRQTQRVERYGYALTKGQAERLQRRDDGLSDREGDELASAIASVEQEMQDWPNEHLCNACDAMLDQHRQRLADQQAQSAEEAAAENDETPDAEKAEYEDADANAEAQPGGSEGRKYDGPQDAIRRFFDDALDSGGGGEIMEDYRISENQFNRLWAIASENGWDESHLDRMIKDLLGYESKKHIPYGDPYDEVIEALRSDEMRFWMQRDPDTPDMFDGQGEQEPNDKAFEDGADDQALPF